MTRPTIALLATFTLGLLVVSLNAAPPQTALPRIGHLGQTWPEPPGSSSLLVRWMRYNGGMVDEHPPRG
jgi:hypothetical protein